MYLAVGRRRDLRFCDFPPWRLQSKVSGLEVLILPIQAARTAFRPSSSKMNLNYTSPGAQMPTQRSTSFFIEDILLHKPKPLRDVFPSPFSNSLASRMPLLEYGYPLMPTPILASHPHHPLHKPEHHPYFFTSGKNSLSAQIHYTGHATSTKSTAI